MALGSPHQWPSHWQTHHFAAGGGPPEPCPPLGAAAYRSRNWVQFPGFQFPTHRLKLSTAVGNSLQPMKVDCGPSWKLKPVKQYDSCRFIMHPHDHQLWKFQAGLPRCCSFPLLFLTLLLFGLLLFPKLFEVVSPSFFLDRLKESRHFQQGL